MKLICQNESNRQIIPKVNSYKKQQQQQKKKDGKENCHAWVGIITKLPCHKCYAMIWIYLPYNIIVISWYECRFTTLSVLK